MVPNHDFLSKLIGLLRFANALDKLGSEFRAQISLLEKEFLAMLQRRWNYIMLHHSLTKDGATVSWPVIRRYHTEIMGWDDIGYHFGIELIGLPIVGNRMLAKGKPGPEEKDVFEGTYEILMGRPLDQDGAHCSEQGMNHKALGICFVGNFDEIEVPKEQWGKGITLVRSLVKLLDIPASFIVGHRDFSSKSCPGKLFDLGKFRSEVASRL